MAFSCYENSMKKPFLLGTSLFMVVLIAFVYFAQPIKAKADQPTLDYQTTTASLTEVKAMITGMEAAIIPIVFIIIGFLCLTYCTLRNIEVPLSYPSETSFIDKLTQLGEYCFDNATEALKPVLYSVYEFVASGQVVDVTRISSTLPFILINVSKFFTSFGTWIGSSLISDVSEVGQGLLNQFVESLQLSQTNPYNYVDQFEQVFDDYSIYQYNELLGSFNGDYWNNTGSFYYGYMLQQIPQYLILYDASTYVEIYGYKLDNSGENIIPATLGYYRCQFKYSNNNRGNVSPSLSVYQDASYTWYTSNSIRLGSPGSGNSSYYRVDYQQLVNELNTLVGLGIALAQVTEIPTSSIPVEQLKTIINPEALKTPWSDQVYSPTDDSLGANIDDLAIQIAGNTAAIASLSELIALLTQNQALTLDSAITDVQTINSAGDYVFPSMDNIWKYPKYFFETLHGWGLFVKGCLGAVTVGDGGLSWLFYGGFVLLICGGVIGKILLG